MTKRIKKTAVMFVCLGNICRSPTAHGVFAALVDRVGLHDSISIESSGTSGWHIGESPDSRSSQAALQRGYDLSNLKGRAFSAEDFNHYDYILTMDRANLKAVQALRPAGYVGELALFLDFSSSQQVTEVPDPYYGGAKGFDTVLDLVEDGCAGLLNHIKQHRS